MLGGRSKENGQPLIGTLLILGGDAEHYIIVPLSPVFWEGVGKPLWTFGEQTEEDVWSLADDAPCLTVS
jgi:hypothetical protein